MISARGESGERSGYPAARKTREAGMRSASSALTAASPRKQVRSLSRSRVSPRNARSHADRPGNGCHYAPQSSTPVPSTGRSAPSLARFPAGCKQKSSSLGAVVQTAGTGAQRRRVVRLSPAGAVRGWFAPNADTSLTRTWWLPLSATGSATSGGAAAAPVLATSGRLASTGRFELGGGAVVFAVRAIRALRDDRRPDRGAGRGAKAGLAPRGSAPGEGRDRAAANGHCLRTRGRTPTRVLLRRSAYLTA